MPRLRSETLAGTRVAEPLTLQFKVGQELHNAAPRDIGQHVQLPDSHLQNENIVSFSLIMACLVGGSAIVGAGFGYSRHNL